MGRDVTSGRCRHAVALRDQQGSTREVAGPRCFQAQRGKVDRQRRKRARATDKLGMPLADRAFALVVPDGGAGAYGHPAPPQDALEGEVDKRLRRSLQRGRRDGASSGVEQGAPVQQQVEAARSPRWRWGPPKERWGRGHAAAGLGPPGRTLKLRGDLLIRPGRGLRPVPGPAIRIGLRVGYRLAHARVAAYHQDPALTGPDGVDEPVKL